MDHIENKVAFGVAFKDGTGFGNKIHGVDMMPGCVRVSVDGCINPKALLPVPVPGEMETVIQALGSHVAWPEEFILYQDSEPSQVRMDFIKSFSYFNHICMMCTCELCYGD